MPQGLSRFVAAQHLQELHRAMPTLLRKVDAVVQGRATPTLENIQIGSGRKVVAIVTFFDIRGFTARTSSDDDETLKKSLLLLNLVIPAMMRVLFRQGAYVEKNTGDGLMAISGVEEAATDAQGAARAALFAAAEMFYVLETVVNPALAQLGIERVDARIGMDMGKLIIARIGLPNGSSAHGRNSLTAIGPAANLASKFQAMAGTNEIFCGDSLRNKADPSDHLEFDDFTPANWSWTYGNGTPYRVWRYGKRLSDPLDWATRVRMLAALRGQ